MAKSRVLRLYNCGEFWPRVVVPAESRAARRGSTMGRNELREYGPKERGRERERERKEKVPKERSKEKAAMKTMQTKICAFTSSTTIINMSISIS